MLILANNIVINILYTRNADAKAMTYKKLRQDRTSLQTNFNSIEKVSSVSISTFSEDKRATSYIGFVTFHIYS